MKTITYINSEIDSLDSEAKELKEIWQQRAKKKLLNRIEYLKEIKLYLETEPREDFVKSEINRLETLVKNIDSDFQEYLKRDDSKRELKVIKEEFYKERPTKKHKKHIKNLKFILIEPDL